MKVAVVQNSPVFGKTQSNLDHALELASTVRADLYLLPELFASGYLFSSREELESLAEDANGTTLTALRQFSAHHACAIYAGFPERAGEKIYNSAVLFDKGEQVAIYRKLHLFCDEKVFFDRSEGALLVPSGAGAKLGLMICFDWVFPEVARTLALRGAQILCHVSNLVLPFCQKAMVTRSIENGVFTVLANRVGTDRSGDLELTFTGGSRIISPKGEVLAAAPTVGEAVLVAEVDAQLADNKWITKRNHLFDDRRSEAYWVD
jgi:predicted amidohydrolase